MGEVGNTEDETDGIEDVGFTGSVEAGDCIEVCVKAVLVVGKFEVDRLNKNNGISRNKRDDCLVHIGS